MSPARVALAILCTLVLAVPGTGRAAAQQPDASPFLPQGHWSVEALRRLHGLGLTPSGYDPGTELQYAHEVVAALRAAADRSDLAASWLALLARELGDDAGLTESAGTGQAASITRLTIGAVAAEGRLLGGTGELEDGDWTGPIPLADRRGPVAGVDHAGSHGPVAYGLTAVVPAESDPLLRAAYGVVTVRHVGVWAGIRPGGFRTGAGGSLVLTTLQPRPGLGVQLTRPVRLPWHLARLGPARFSTDFTRARQNYVYEHPWIWTMRGMLEPHPRFQVGINRAVMLGGGGRSVSPRDLAYILIGKHTGSFDNQIVALAARFRPPTEAFLPLVGYFEWGAEDSAGAWRDVPGIIVGIEAPALPFAPSTAVGVSLTRFAGSCCGNPSWYTNHAFRGGWTDNGRLLGHPLGGHGREWLAYGRADLLDARLQVDARLFARTRGAENLLAPLRQGRSLGGSAGMLLFLSAGWQASLQLAVEEDGAREWRQLSLDAALRATL